MLQTISLTLVSQQPDTSIQWWWIIVSAGLLVSGLSGTLIAIGVKNNRTKKREQEIAKLKQKTQIFDDITNIKGILLIEKQSGLLMYRHVISGLDEENEELFSGFIRAILLLASDLSGMMRNLRRAWCLKSKNSLNLPMRTSRYC